MPCIRTGFHAYLDYAGTWIYGDAFELDSVYCFRVCQISYDPIDVVKHFTIKNFAHWFDEGRTDTSHNSTMICASDHVINHGYDGVPLDA